MEQVWNENRNQWKINKKQMRENNTQMSEQVNTAHKKDKRQQISRSTSGWVSQYKRGMSGRSINNR